MRTTDHENQKITPKSPNQIIDEWFCQSRLASVTEQTDWLRASMAALLVWSAREVANTECCIYGSCEATAKSSCLLSMCLLSIASDIQSSKK